MDKLMGLKVEPEVTSRFVDRPSCPQCGQAVHVCFRYGDSIKAFYEDLVSIKMEYSKDDTRRLPLDKPRNELAKTKIIVMNYGLEEATKSILDETTNANFSRLSRDDRWHLLRRIHLFYRFICLLNDVKRIYTYNETKNDKNKKSSPSNMTIDSDKADRLIQEGVVALRVVTKCRDAGPDLSLELLKKYHRLDLQRQLFVVDAIVKKRPDRKLLAEAADLFNNKQDLSEQEEDYLTQMLSAYASEFRINVASSVRNDMDFIQRLSMASQTWVKCLTPHCETIFSLIRSPECPECEEVDDQQQ